MRLVASTNGSRRRVLRCRRCHSPERWLLRPVGNDRGTSVVVLRCNADSRLGRCDPGAFPPRPQTCSDTRISTSAVDTHPDRTVHRAIHVKLPKNSLKLPLIAALFVPICRNFRPPLRKNLKENSLDHSSTSQVPILIAFVPWGCSRFQGCTPPLRLQSETPLPPSPRPASRHTRRSWSWDRRERHD